MKQTLTEEDRSLLYCHFPVAQANEAASHWRRPLTAILSFPCCSSKWSSLSLKRTAHCYIVTSLLLNQMKQPLTEEGRSLLHCHFPVAQTNEAASHWRWPLTATLSLPCCSSKWSSLSVNKTAHCYNVTSLLLKQMKQPLTEEDRSLLQCHFSVAQKMKQPLTEEDRSLLNCRFPVAQTNEADSHWRRPLTATLLLPCCSSKWSSLSLKMTAHCYIVTSLLLKQMKQPLTEEDRSLLYCHFPVAQANEAASHWRLCLGFQFFFSSVQRTNNFGSVLPNRLDPRI